jgi:peptidoglycan/xylan/chitin deacetylase (PgdA/CDA1 family)
VSLLVLLYHQLEPERFEQQLKHIVEHYPVVLPGDSLDAKLSVCITLDDAYEDAHTVAWPLLRKYRLQALLAVAPALVGQTSYCNWEQLAEMAASAQWAIASHSMTHCNMAQDPIDVYQEVVGSKQLLEERLGVSVNSFIYPYGKVGHHAEVMRHYQYAMRIGTAYNRSWECQGRPLHRVCADGVDPFPLHRRLGYWAKLAVKTCSI